jgi:uncharacterized FlaG/YvyC family protein
MSDNPVSNVKRVEATNIQATQVQVQTQTTTSQAVNKDVNKIKTTDDVNRDVQTNQEQKSTQKQGVFQGRETNLKFEVDTKTHQVTVMIMDKDTNKVISTIPPDKIKDIPPGDLAHFAV